MAEAEDKRLHDFFCKNKRKFEELSREEEEGGEIELSLGLSLNGRFGVDPNQPLSRSSSVSNLSFPVGSGGVEAYPAAEGLGRTWSMPAAMEEEGRRRREAQSVRRMEAKRKRVEKMKNGGVRTENGRIGERHVSIGSQGSGSSGVSESEPQPTNQLANTPIEAINPSNGQNKHGQTVPMAGTNTKPTTNNNDPKEMTRKNMMVDMPRVSTRGPSGKRIEGFLYRYRKGEEVRIVCVCHGSFLTPAEFVKHAGGGDVAHPLKHIVVNPFPLM